MKITHYLYNTFLIESGDKKIAIDPGGEQSVSRLNLMEKRLSILEILFFMKKNGKR